MAHYRDLAEEWLEMAHAPRTAQEWFEEAAQCYVEGHQACAWCGGCHRVFKTTRRSRLEYHCTDCDFYVSQDEQTGEYAVEPGEEQAAGTGRESMTSRGCLGIR
jgi:hypothetical protein